MFSGRFSGKNLQDSIQMPDITKKNSNDCKRDVIHTWFNKIRLSRSIQYKDSGKIYFIV